jgi:hypothetical protein
MIILKGSYNIITENIKIHSSYRQTSQNSPYKYKINSNSSYSLYNIK